MLTCGFVRSNLAFATWCPPGLVGACSCSSAVYILGAVHDSRLIGASLAPAPIDLFAGRLGDDLLRHVVRNLRVRIEHHGVVRPALGLRPQVTDVTEHLR